MDAGFIYPTGGLFGPYLTVNCLTPPIVSRYLRHSVHKPLPGVAVVLLTLLVSADMSG
ncbi:hypothetical protein PCASD_05712, partial [Puccinia coronata f. sp. avenae]